MPPTPRSTRRSARSGWSRSSERMPDGLDTIVHERGQSLSSGERQLIALARAFLAHPRVLVSTRRPRTWTSHPKRRSRPRSTSSWRRGRPILIAHRLTTAMKADRIVVVDDGRIVEDGHTTSSSSWVALCRDVRHLDEPVERRGGGLRGARGPRLKCLRFPEDRQWIQRLSVPTRPTSPPPRSRWRGGSPPAPHSGAPRRRGRRTPSTSPSSSCTR